jgi:hypothetical protein
MGLDERHKLRHDCVFRVIKPSGPLARGPLVNTGVFALSWLHPVRSWSLRESRRGSQSFLRLTGDPRLENGPRLARRFGHSLIGSLACICPAWVVALAHERWPRWVPPPEFQTDVRPREATAIYGVSRDLDRSITPSPCHLASSVIGSARERVIGSSGSFIVSGQRSKRPGSYQQQDLALHSARLRP